MLTHSHILNVFHSLSLLHTHIHTLTRAHTHTHTHSHTLTHTHTHTHAHTHTHTHTHLICWLASLRIFSTSLPLSSSSLVSVLMFSFRVWISWSRSAIWFFLRVTSS